MARSLEPVRPPGPRTPGVLGQAAARTSAGEVIRRVSPGDIVLEDYRPLPLNLEWRLSELYWIAEGVRPFITDAVLQRPLPSLPLLQRACDLMALTLIVESRHDDAYDGDPYFWTATSTLARR